MFLLLNLKFPPPRLPVLPSHARPTLPHTCILHVSPRVRTYPPKSLPYNKNYSHSHHVSINTAISSSAIPTKMEESIDAVHLRSHFLQVIQSRRPSQPQVPVLVEVAKPVANPLYQDNPPPLSEAMESCPKQNIDGFKDLLKEENLYLITEAGEQGRLPVLILSMKENNHQRKPAVVFLHSTNKAKEWLRPLLEAYASRGYVAIAIDSRYHGERASSKTTYRDALISSWKKGDTMPFIFDTAWDLIKLADYLTQREDIDPARIGITGESLGGMHAWFGAAADTRYAVVVPIIGVQGFHWAIENDKWQGRVDSLKPLFEEARIDLGKSAIDKEVVEKVWDRIAPGLASHFDSPYTIPAIAPRPLLILNGAEDPRCPLAGVKIPESRAHKAYGEAHCSDKFKFIAQPGIGHQMTRLMVKEASDWFERFLKQ
ncbi:putative esterase yitv [Fagus crenata]